MQMVRVPTPWAICNLDCNEENERMVQMVHGRRIDIVLLTVSVFLLEKPKLNSEKRKFCHSAMNVMGEVEDVLQFDPVRICSTRCRPVLS